MEKHSSEDWFRSHHAMMSFVHRRVSPHQRVITITVFISLFVILHLSSYGQMQSPEYQIPRDAVSGGGAIGATGGAYTVDDIAGQSSPVGSSSSTDYTIHHGYLVETDIFPNAAFSAGLLADSHSYGVAWTDFDNDGAGRRQRPAKHCHGREFGNGAGRWYGDVPSEIERAAFFKHDGNGESV